MSRKHVVLACFSILIVPCASVAHSPIEGIDSFYNGLLHPVLVPAHLLLLIVVGLFLGQQGLRRVELAMGVFAGATIMGLIAAWFPIAPGLEPLVLVLAAVVGLLVAIRLHATLLWCVLIVLLGGFSLGLDSAQEELFGKDRLVSLFGSCVAIYFLVLYPMALAESFNKKAWQQIGVRIVGSWVAASSLIVLALSLSAKP